MHPVLFASIVFGFTFGGTLLGMLIAYLLPQHHFASEARDSIKVGSGLIATMAALVLGLMVASAKASYDAQRTAYQTLAQDIFLMDRALLRYGPEAKGLRTLFKKRIEEIVDAHWPTPGSGPANSLDSSSFRMKSAELFAALGKLQPVDDDQKTIKAQVLSLTNDLGRARWVVTNGEEMDIPMPFLAFVVFWLSLLFINFGLLAPRNATVIAVLFVCALAVASALYLIMDLDQPTQGLFQISDKAFRKTLAQMGT